MSMNRRSFMSGVAAVGGAAALGGFGAMRAARAQTGVDFAGETIEFVIPFSEGGGSDVWARFYAPYLSKHLPGNPNVIVRNVPGGGSITGANEFAARARPDGLSLLGTSGSTQFPYLLKDPRVRYDYTRLLPVVASPTGGVCYLPASFEVADASQLGQIAEQELIYASQGATSLDLVPMLAFVVMGLNVRHVFGMTGRGDGRLAFERGEATIDYQTSSAYQTSVEPLVEAGDAVPMFSWGIIDANGDVQRDPTFPDIPHFIEAYEMMHGSAPSGPEFDAYMAFFASGFAAQKPAMLQEGTAPEIVAAYRQAFSEAVADPELQAAKGDILGEYEQAVGDDVDRLYQLATNIDPNAQTWAQEFLAENYNVRF